MRSLLSLATIALAIVLFACLCHAQDKTDRTAKTTISPVKRSVNFADEKPHFVRSWAVSKTGRGADKEQDAISFQFTTLGWPRFRARYFSKSKDLSVFFKYRVGLAGVTEYTGDQWKWRQGGSDNNVVSAVWLKSPKGDRWSDMSKATTGTGDDQVTRFSTTFSPATGPQANAKITLVAAFSANNQTLVDAGGQPNGIVGPNAVKFDVIIEDWQYQANGSRLALVLVTQAVSAVKVRSKDGDNDPDSGVDVGNGGSFVWFGKAWHKFKNGTGKYIDVVTSDPIASPDTTIWTVPDDVKGSGNDDDDPLEATQVRIATLVGSEEHPDKIEWDPQLTISDSTNSAAKIFSNIFTLSLLALFAFAANALAATN